MGKLSSGRVKRTPQTGITSDRYEFLGLRQAEPNLGDPILVYPPIPVGEQYQLITVLNDPIPGSRYWMPTVGGLIPGSISVYDEGYLVGSSSSITQLNFVGTGNTFLVNGTTIDISIAGGGSAGAGGTWASDAVGVHTTKIVGVNTTAAVGTANSEGALQAFGNIAITDGVLITDQNIDQNVFIPSGKNGLLIGPVTVGVGLTVDIASGSVLVVV